MTTANALPPLSVSANHWRRKVVWMVGLILGVVVLSFALDQWGSGRPTSHTWFILVGGVAIVTTALLQIPRSLNRGPVLILRDEGMTDHTSPLAFGFIAREEIEAV